MKKAFKFRSLLLISTLLVGFLSAYDKCGLEVKSGLLKMLEKPIFSTTDIRNALLTMHNLALIDYVRVEHEPMYQDKFSDQLVPHRRIFRAEDIFLKCLLTKPAIELSDKHVHECFKSTRESNGVSFVTEDTLFLVGKIVEARRKISGAIG